MEKRLIIAMALSLAVLLTFQALQPKKPQNIEVQEAALPPEEGSVPAASFPREQQEAFKETEQEKTTLVETDIFEIVFSNKGGNIKNIFLKGSGKKELLYEEVSGKDQLFALKNNLVPYLDQKSYSYKESENSLEYKRREEGLVEVTKRYTFHKAFNYITLDIKIENLTDRSILFSYDLNGPCNIDQSSKVAGRTFLEADSLIDEKIWRTKPGKNTQTKTGNIFWTAIKNRYYTLLLKPGTSPAAVTMGTLENKNLFTKVTSKEKTIPSGGTISESYLLYAGPLDESAIAAIGDDNLEKIINYGFFGGLSKILLSALRFFHGVSNNWGIAIILLTLLINLILFPLTIKSFVSMQQMKTIQPHIQKLRELHKDNPQRLNKETMELYKQYNVNPLGGCLPLLLQMPIFISLYQGLMRSIELKGASFLWIKDLAKPDAVPIPFSLPFIGNAINVLPILMAGIMFVQQQFSQPGMGAATQEQETQQKMMMFAMPILFGFLFYKMPSGLVLYWLTNTVLMTTEQMLIKKKMGM